MAGSFFTGTDAELYSGTKNFATIIDTDFASGPLLAMADLYCITELKLELSNYISRNVRRENAVMRLVEGRGHPVGRDHA